MQHTVSLKLGIAGTRGIPARYGGFETFAEELAGRLQQLGYTVTVYSDPGATPEWKHQGVRVVGLPIPKSGFQPLYFFLSLWYGLRQNDVLIVTSTAASFFYFINVFFRKKIITNTDGEEGRRSKWNLLGRTYLNSSEWVAAKCSSLLVADSFGIEQYLKRRYPACRPVSVIAYGAYVFPASDANPSSIPLEAESYYIIVARLEPENNIAMMIDGFKQSGSNKKLVIIGQLADNDYCRSLAVMASASILFVGAIYDKALLRQWRLNAFAYLHGHSVGGTNPSLLEAMGCGNISICHNNVYNREVTDDKMLYFDSAEEAAIRLRYLEQLDATTLQAMRQWQRNRITTEYSWEKITMQYHQLLMGG